jgi:hypothetical protein
MNNVTVVRVLPVAIAAVAMSGVAVAASAAAKPSGYTACANSKHQLAVSHHGTCAKHFYKVKIGSRGPAGAQGPSDVYVASGSVTVAAPVISRQSHIAPGPALQLSLPAGSYLLSWKVEFSGSKSVIGDTNPPYSVILDCDPESTTAGFGQDDLTKTTVVSDSYDGGSNTTRYDFIVPLSNFWAIKVPSGGTKITMNCGPPILTGTTGVSTTVDSESLSGQIVATRTAHVHGSDAGQL